MSSPSLGSKIRYFRKRANISQLDLELDINAASGMMSRIESDEVNPLKETIIKIADKLKLNDRERDYLYGVTAHIATDDEVSQVKSSVKDYFNVKGVFAYIIDDRSRLVALSESFFKFFGWDSSMSERIFNRSFVSFLLDEKLDVKNFIPDDDWEDVLVNVLKRFYKTSGFMIEEQSYRDSVESINADKFAKKLWTEVTSVPADKIFTENTRQVYFVFKGVKVKNNYSLETLPDHPRFEFVEYVSVNPLIKLLQGIL